VLSLLVHRMRRVIGWVLFLVSSRSAVKLIVQVFLFLNKVLRLIRKKKQRMSCDVEVLYMVDRSIRGRT
jgi:hypothetical protein